MQNFCTHVCNVCVLYPSVTQRLWCIIIQLSRSISIIAELLYCYFIISGPHIALWVTQRFPPQLLMHSLCVVCIFFRVHHPQMWPAVQKAAALPLFVLHRHGDKQKQSSHPSNNLPPAKAESRKLADICDIKTPKARTNCCIAEPWKELHPFIWDSKAAVVFCMMLFIMKDVHPPFHYLCLSGYTHNLWNELSSFFSFLWMTKLLFASVTFDPQQQNSLYVLITARQLAVHSPQSFLLLLQVAPVCCTDSFHLCRNHIL